MGCLLRQGDDVTMILYMHTDHACMHIQKLLTYISNNSLYIGFHLESELLIRPMSGSIIQETVLHYLHILYSSHPSLQSRLCVHTSLSKFVRKLVVYCRVHEL